jgi:hypothetical protein
MIIKIVSIVELKLKPTTSPAFSGDFFYKEGLTFTNQILILKQNGTLHEKYTLHTKTY